jgi:tetratricopeptide (TPR) repeat protein
LLGRTSEAIIQLQRLLALRKEKLGQDHPDTLITMSNLAQAYRDAGRTAEAIGLFQDVLAVRRVKRGPEHLDTLKSMNDLAAVYLDAKRWADAEALLRECLGLREKTKLEEWRRFHTMNQLGASLGFQGKYTEAETLLINGYEGLVANEAKIPLSRKKDLSMAAARIAPFYDAWGKPETAAAWRQKLSSPAEAQKPAR